MDRVPVEKVPFLVKICHNLSMIWMYRSQQVITIPLSEPWVVKKTGGGIRKVNEVTHEETELEKDDYVKALINFMSDPVSYDDFTDGLNLVIGKQWDKNCVSWVNILSEHRNVAYYNISCKNFH